MRIRARFAAYWQQQGMHTSNISFWAFCAKKEQSLRNILAEFGWCRVHFHHHFNSVQCYWLNGHVWFAAYVFSISFRHLCRSQRTQKALVARKSGYRVCTSQRNANSSIAASISISRPSCRLIETKELHASNLRATSIIRLQNQFNLNILIITLLHLQNGLYRAKS